MKLNVLRVLVAVFAFAAFVVAPTAGSADEVPAEVPGEEVPAEEVPAEEAPAEALGVLAEQGCEANNVCGYSATNFEGSRAQVPCSQSGDWYTAFTIRSARNRCGNKINYLGNYAICMNPGGDRPNPGSFAFIRLPAGWAPPYC